MEMESEQSFEELEAQLNQLINEINNLNEILKKSQYEQDEFNTRFIIKFMIFLTFYRFYTMNVDLEGKLMIEILNNEKVKYVSIEFENLHDEVD
jgi:hypothetical protein